jgi:hypothetical protein
VKLITVAWLGPCCASRGTRRWHDFELFALSQNNVERLHAQLVALGALNRIARRQLICLAAHDDLQVRLEQLDGHGSQVFAHVRGDRVGVFVGHEARNNGLRVGDHVFFRHFDPFRFIR